MFVKNYSKVPSRFCRICFDTKGSIGNTERYLLRLHFFLIKRNSVFLGSVAVYSLKSMTGQRPSMTVNHSVPQQSPLMQVAGYHQDRDGEKYHVLRPCYAVELYRG